MARKHEYLDPLIDKGVIFVKGDKDGAMEIIIKLEEKGWIEKKWHTNIVDGKRITIGEYESPDGKWKINLREGSNSGDDLLEKGYKVETTLDVIELGLNGKPKRGGIEEEIKFILLK